ncbi:MAG: DUF58 domain-containing protein [Planctomycetota bacterium]
MKYEVFNTGALLPVWMLRVNDAISPVNVPEMSGPTDEQESAGAERENATRRQRRRTIKRQRLLSQQWKPAPLIAGVGLIPAESSRTSEVECRFLHRGEYRLGPLEASTAYPFSLMSCDRLAINADLDSSVYIYPRPLKLHRGWRRMLPPRRGGDGLRTAGQSGYHGEFYGVRKWQSGDHVKQIHWRTTARIGEPAVRQLERRPQHSVSVVVDLFFAAPSEYEELLEFAMTVLEELTGITRDEQPAKTSAFHRPTHIAVADQFATEGAEGRRFFGAGLTGHELRANESDGLSPADLLKRLATANATTNPETLPRLLSENAELLTNTDLVVLSQRSMNEALRQQSAPTRSVDDRGSGLPEASSEEMERCRELAGFLNQRHRLTWLDLRMPSVSRWIDCGPNKSTLVDVAGARRFLSGSHDQSTVSNQAQ